tara:strand:+ start:1790 stop:2215 length:426 start_codon:yes stop_codon:yes gene_type:complete
MSKAIDEALYAHLISDQTAGSAFELVQGRVSAQYGDPSDDLPLITFEQTGGVMQQTFGGTLMMMDESYDVTIVGRWEDGLADIGDIADQVVELFGTPVYTTGTDLDRVVFEISSATSVTRDEEHLLATIGLRAKAVQTGGL